MKRRILFPTKIYYKNTLTCRTKNYGLFPFFSVTEICGPKFRARFGILTQFPFGIGASLLPVIAYFVRSWVPLQVKAICCAALFSNTEKSYNGCFTISACHLNSFCGSGFVLLVRPRESAVAGCQGAFQGSFENPEEGGRH